MISDPLIGWPYDHGLNNVRAIVKINIYIRGNGIRNEISFDIAWTCLVENVWLCKVWIAQMGGLYDGIGDIRNRATIFSSTPYICSSKTFKSKLSKISKNIWILELLDVGTKVVILLGFCNNPWRVLNLLGTSVRPGGLGTSVRPGIQPPINQSRIHRQRDSPQETK